MISVQKVTRTHFDALHPLFEAHDPSIAVEVWRTIFEHPWAEEDGWCGNALFEDDRAVGFLGTIFSRRLIAGRMERFCNLTTWVVEEKFRGHSLSLLLPLLRLDECTLTDLSPSPSVVKISKRLGFQELETSVEILLPVTELPDQKEERWDALDLNGEAELNAQDEKLCKDHSGQGKCRHLVFAAGKQRCLIIYTKVSNCKIPYSHILHISDHTLFAQANLAIRKEIERREQTALVIIDPRFLGGLKLPRSVTSPFRVTKLFLSRHLRPEQIDNLYSELVLLDFSTLPSAIRNVLREWKERENEAGGSATSEKRNIRS